MEFSHHFLLSFASPPLIRDFLSRAFTRRQGLGYLCEKAGSQFSKLVVYGMKHLTDEGFYLCHGRDNFEIEGVFMAPSGDEVKNKKKKGGRK